MLVNMEEEEEEVVGVEGDKRGWWVFVVVPN